MIIASILMEAAMAGLAMFAAWRGRTYFYGFAFSFATYTYYDVSRMLAHPVEGALLAALFLSAVVAALISLGGLYLEWEAEEDRV